MKEEGTMKEEGRKIIVVMASRQRATKELERITFSPDTTSGGGSSRVSLRGLPEGKRNLINLKRRQKK